MVNILLNPSVEDGVDQPDSWSAYITPEMQALISWINDPHTGLKGLSIEATHNPAASQYQSALWRQMTNNIVVGKQYRFRCWYKSNITASLVILHLNDIPDTISAFILDLPPSASFIQSAWLTTTIPAGTVEVWADARLYNRATGWAVFDDFEYELSEAPPPPPPPPPPSAIPLWQILAFWGAIGAAGVIVAK